MRGDVEFSVQATGNRRRNKIFYPPSNAARGVLMGVVLIVEDDEQVRVLAQSAVQDTDHQALTASNVDEALALLRDEQQQIDLLFTDIALWDDTQGGNS